jgi:predicted MFS family arabinose efflux permease
MFVGAAVLLGGFIFTEQRAESPLMPLRLFRNKSLAGANVVGLMLGASIFSMFFLLTLYMQQVLGYSALRTGIGYLLVASVIIVSAAASQALVTKIGVRTVLATGMGLTVAGLLYFSQISVNGSYLTDLAPGFILTGVGLGFSFVPVTIAALVGVEMNDAGIASGIINTSQQIGGALGTAILSTVAFTRVTDYLTTHAPAPDLLLRADVDGFSIAFLVGAGLSALGLLATLTMVPRGVAPEHVAEEATEPVAA